MDQLKWVEPASFIRARKQALRQGLTRRRQFILFLSCLGGLAVIFGIAFAIGYHRHGFKNADPLPVWVFPAIALGVAFAIAYLVPWVSSLTVAKIAVGLGGIYRTSRESAMLVFERWPWDAIASCRVDATPFAASDYDALRVTLRNGQTVYIGLNETVDVDSLRELLRSASKWQSRRSQNG
jgi:hypothetical protein